MSLFPVEGFIEMIVEMLWVYDGGSPRELTNLRGKPS